MTSYFIYTCYNVMHVTKNKGTLNARFVGEIYFTEWIALETLKEISKILQLEWDGTIRD